MINKNTAKIFFNTLLLTLLESFAPSGAVKILIEATDNTIGKFTYPIEYLGISATNQPVNM